MQGPLHQHGVTRLADGQCERLIAVCRTADGEVRRVGAPERGRAALRLVKYPAR